jgi:deazaflavin-dependent oxidoreductase (nitroreductase family)
VSDPPPRPGRLRRLLFRLPLTLEGMSGRWMERLFTRIVGVPWIVLETIGRRTGRLHRVTLDIVGHDHARDVYYVQPAYGRGSDWVRNVHANPAIRARVRDQWLDVRVRDATGPEGAAVVLAFVRAHPLYARIIIWFVGYVDRIERPDDELRRGLETTPVLAIEVVGAANRASAARRGRRENPPI